MKKPQTNCKSSKLNWFCILNVSLVREKKSQEIPSVESFENYLYIVISKNACFKMLVNGVQFFTFRYHYENSQGDYTHKDKKKSQLQVL